MARVTHVKKAQKRFRTVPVLGEDGKQKVVPVLNRRGEPKTTKTGRAIVRRLTTEDPNQPLPNRKCEKCSTEIEPGMPYKWVKPKSGPYGGSKRFRCAVCPSWQVWELSQSLSARIAQIDHDARANLNEEDPDSVSEALKGAAEAVRELAEEKSEAAQNTEDGFGHPTEKSEELQQIADDLEAWADELESAGDEAADVEVGDETIDCEECNGEGTTECSECGGEGKIGEDDCGECGGSGEIDCEECEDGQVENQEREQQVAELEDKLSVLDNVPV